MSTPDFFRSRFDAMIDLQHPLAVLARRLPWDRIEQAQHQAMQVDVQVGSRPEAFDRRDRTAVELVCLQTKLSQTIGMRRCNFVQIIFECICRRAGH